jgi:serine/threonine-protein kinase RsbW
MLPSASVDWDWTMERTLPGNEQLGHAAIDELEAALRKSGWDGRELFHIRMAVQEGVDNAIQHGNKCDPAKQVHLVFRVAPLLCYIQITDEGCGFCRATLKNCTDEEQLDKPRGRGVHLIEQLMSETSYNERGNQLTMVRRRFDPRLAATED